MSNAMKIVWGNGSAGPPCVTSIILLVCIAAYSRTSRVPDATLAGQVGGCSCGQVQTTTDCDDRPCDPWNPGQIQQRSGETLAPGSDGRYTPDPNAPPGVGETEYDPERQGCCVYGEDICTPVYFRCP